MKIIQLVAVLAYTEPQLPDKSQILLWLQNVCWGSVTAKEVKTEKLCT